MSLRINKTNRRLKDLLIFQQYSNYLFSTNAKIYLCAKYIVKVFNLNYNIISFYEKKTKKNILIVYIFLKNIWIKAICLGDLCYIGLPDWNSFSIFSRNKLMSERFNRLPRYIDCPSYQYGDLRNFPLLLFTKVKGNQ